MRVRALLWLTAIVSSILGAIAVYLVLTVPNDLQADSMLKQARKDLAAGKRNEARDALVRVVQQYPRTDAAAAATVALVSVLENDREKLAADVARLSKATDEQNRMLASLQKTLEQIKSTPPPKPPEVKAPTKKPAPKKKVTPKRRTTRTRRRR